MDLIKSLFARRTSAARRPASFVLRYAPSADRPIVVGRLDFDGRTWTFRYDEEYKRHPELRPIEGFDDVNEEYRSAILFPFFAVRVPDQDRKDIRRRLDQEAVKHPEPADLLRLFGRKVVSSPAFELESA